MPNMIRTMTQNNRDESTTPDNKGTSHAKQECNLPPNSGAVIDRGREILRRESDAILAAHARLGPSFVQAVQLVEQCTGRIGVTGIGKARDIGNKIQSTLASTGSPSYRIHPVEALHGDLGMIQPNDVILMLSKSGETQELIHLCPLLKKIGCKLILITAKPNSTCALLCDIVLEIGDAPEACPLGLAPSSSTAAMLAIGDALALTVMERKNVKPEQYASFHPGGSLGRSLMIVSEIMRTGGDCPAMPVTGTLRDYRAAVEQAPRRAGAAAVIDDAQKLVGFFTHGDYFRLMDEAAIRPDTLIRDVMTANPKFARERDLVADALVTMRRHMIDELPVVDEHHKLIGMIDIQDLVAEGFSAFDIG